MTWPSASAPTARSWWSEVVSYLAALNSADGPDRLAPLRRAAQSAEGWRLAVDEPGVLVLVRGGAPVRGLQAGRGWIVGDLYREGREVGPEPPSTQISQNLSSLEVAQDLCAHFWGRYVAVICDRTKRLVFRDPSGAVEALRWNLGPLAMVGSELPDWMPAVYWPDLTIDWPAVSTWLGGPSAAAVSSGLAGLSSVTPGAAQDETGAEVQIWRPERFARNPAPDIAALPDLLDRCVGALAGGAQAIQAEISGGLDSAILAASLSRTAGDKVREWVNYHAADGQGDERVFARQVATLLELPLCEAEKPPFVLTQDILEESALGLRPGFTALDGQRDADGAARALSLGVDRVFTGQGGDMVFFQTPTPVLAADHWRRRRLAGLFSPYVLEVGRWTRASVWSLTARAFDRQAAWPGEASVADHPWMEATADLPPGKRAHIAYLAQKLAIHFENRRSRLAEVIHPLICQPMMEQWLAIPADVLTLGGRDRGLARAAFGGRLPPQIARRRGKGELTGYYGRGVGASLSWARPYLLDGRLAAEGLIDRSQFGEVLTPEHQIWRGEAYLVLTALTVEAWARRWERAGPG